MNQYSPRMTVDQGGSELVYSRMDASTAREIADGWKYAPHQKYPDHANSELSDEKMIRLVVKKKHCKNGQG